MDSIKITFVELKRMTTALLYVVFTLDGAIQ